MPDDDKAGQEPAGKGQEPEPKAADKGIDFEKLDPVTKEFVNRILKDKQDANAEAKARREALESLAEAAGIPKDQLKPEMLKDLSASAQQFKAILEILKPSEGKPAEEQLKELQGAKQQLSEVDDAITEMIDAELQDVPEDMRDLIPEGKPLSKLRWIRNAKARGLFKQQTPPESIGKPPPSTRPGEIAVTEADRSYARRYGGTPEEAAETRIRRERRKAGESISALRDLKEAS